MQLTKVLPVYSLFRISNVIAVFVITILMSRLTGVSGFGIFSLMLANAGLLNLVSSLGVEASVAYHSASGEIPLRSLQTHIWSIAAIQLIMVVAVEGLHFYFTQKFWLISSGNLAAIVIGGLYFLSLSIGEKYIYLFNGKQLFSRCSSLILYCNMLLLLLLIIAFLNTNTKSFINYLALYVGCNVVQTIVLIIVWHRLYKFHFSFKIQFREDEAKMILSYSIIAFFTNIIQYIAYKTDLWLLQYHQGTDNLGMYSLASRLAQFFWILPGLFANIILVKTASQNNDDHTSVQQLIRWMNIGNILCVTFFLLFSHKLIPFIFGDSFYETNILFLLLIPGSVLFCNVITLAAIFGARKKLKINLVGSLICLVIAISLNSILIPAMGMKGAATATSVALIITSLYYFITYNALYKVSSMEFFLPQKNDFIMLKEYIQIVLKKNKQV